jgi:phenylacetate-CoA ligase
MSFWQNKIYPKLPFHLQNLAISAFGYVWQKRRFGGIFKETVKEFKAREFFSKEEWINYQTIELRKILLHAFEQVPYYNNIFKEQNISKTEIEKFQLNDIKKLPFLTKETLRAKGRTEMIATVTQKGAEFFSSSGSTGTPTSIMYSHETHQKISALYEARCRNWANVNYKDSRGMIGGRRVVPDGDSNPPYYRFNFIEKQLYFSAYHISKKNAIDYFNGIEKYKPKYLTGYAMSNYILAKYFKELGLQPKGIKAILTSSEKLTNEMRKVFKEVYQCKVFDAWSGMEWCGLISENEFGQLLYSPDSAFIEFLRPDGSDALPGEEAEVVCTGFLNYDQPLIRYKIGDLVRISKNQETKCGRNFLVIDEIIGRMEDTVVGRDGREMVRFHGIFLGLTNVLKSQIIQEDYDQFIINIESTGLTSEEKSTIHQRMESQLGKINLQIQEIEKIPVGPNGKYKAVISKIKKN